MTAIALMTMDDRWKLLYIAGLLAVICITLTLYIMVSENSRKRRLAKVAAFEREQISRVMDYTHPEPATCYFEFSQYCSDYRIADSQLAYPMHIVLVNAVACQKFLLTKAEQLSARVQGMEPEIEYYRAELAKLEARWEEVCKCREALKPARIPA